MLLLFVDCEAARRLAVFVVGRGQGRQQIIVDGLKLGIAVHCGIRTGAIVGQRVRRHRIKLINAGNQGRLYTVTILFV